MANLESLLDKDPSTFERPPVLPEGDYLVTVLDYRIDKTPGKDGKEPTQFVEYTYGIQSTVGDSVNEEDLEGIDMAKQKVRDTFYLTDAALYRIREFWEKAGCLEGTMRDSLQASKGQSVILTVAHSPNPREPERPYVNVRGYAAA